ncbi:MAG: HU-CCDC81 and SPOR domain-containing protein [Flavobacteriales bacterium]|nr:HU-CCDC81 and SPOR domain-containing protein [Flavobacteriales bacterium]
MNIELGKYVGDLLYDNDCVIIPDFGGIIANYKRASIQTNQDLFKPATKQLSFNIKLKANDGLLINHVAQMQSVGYQEAQEIVNKGIDAYQLKLDTEGLVNIISVGKISKDKEGNLNFEADTQTNFLPSAFGLSGFTSPAIKREGITMKIERPATPNSTKEVRFISKKLLAAAVAIPLLLASATVYFKTDLVEDVNMSFSSLDPKALLERTYEPRTIDPIKVVEFNNEDNFFEKYSNTIASLYINNESAPLMVDLIEKKAVEPIIEKTVEEIKVSEPVAPTKEVVAPVIGAYHIIGGSFGSKRNANKFVKSLRKSGYDALIVGQSGNGSFRVSYDAYADLKAAQYNLLVIQVNFNAGAWLLKN